MESFEETILETSPNNRYIKLNTILGKGAQKVVYKAIDKEEGLEVAWNSCQTKNAEQLNQEILILRQVRHPNIIQFHDCWIKNNEFVFITELMTSGTLREYLFYAHILRYLRKLQVPNMKIVKRWARQILKGLSYLHSHDPPIIHRDIKCDNLFINGAHGEVKIGDMGTAKMKMNKNLKNYTVIGTPEFLAPEMYEEKGYSEKVDIYAFGMALLEMVTGEYPYSECKNAAQVYRKVSMGLKPDSLSKIKDPEILDLINSCIGKENERLSAQEIIEHPFLAVEPEVVLVVANKNQLTMQVDFKGMDKVSVKFEFNVETDTAEEVVHEMIEEQVLPSRYQNLITGEINRILRDMKSIKRDENLKMKLDGSDSIRHLNPETQTILKLGSSKEEAMSRKISTNTIEDLDFLPLKGIVYTMQLILDYNDDDSIEIIVNDTAIATKRGAEKATEWLDKLHKQDIMTVGDLRDLQEDDWGNLGLTVFANRALRNSLYGKPTRSTKGPIRMPSTSSLPHI